MGSGLTDFSLWAIWAISLVAASTDLARGKIYNWLTIPAMLAGWSTALAIEGTGGLGSSFLGALVGLTLYGWMFPIGILGAGDVKLLMALGAWGDPKYTLNVALIGLLVGGVLGICQLVIRGELLGFITRVQIWISSIRKNPAAIRDPLLNKKIKSPFGVAIAIAAIWTKIANPLAGWWA